MKPGDVVYLITDDYDFQDAGVDDPPIPFGSRGIIVEDVSPILQDHMKVMFDCFPRVIMIETYELTLDPLQPARLRLIS